MSPGRYLAHMDAARPFDAADALRRAMAQRKWYDSGATLPYRARRDALLALSRSLRKHETAILDALHADMRKPVFEAYLSEIGLLHQEIDHALKHLKEWMRPRPVETPLALQPARSTVHIGPLGVVFIIAPWNYPLMLLLSPLVGAIAAGNCAVLKPSEDAPHTAAITERIVREAFVPEHVTLVQGAGSEVVPQLLDGFRFDHVFFTGSPRVGAQVAVQAAKQLVPFTLELGGKSPAIVDCKVNVALAAKRIAWGKCFNAGQTCISPDHVLVQADVMEPFLAAYAKTIDAFFGPDPQNSPHFARIVNARRFDVLKSYLAHGRIRTGGAYDAAERYIAPTVLTDVPWDAPPMREEIFGPILPVIPWREREEVLEIVRRNPFPLSAYVFSKDERNVRFFTERIAFGGGCVDQCLAHFGNPHLPLGGVGTSGMGRYHGHHTFALFSHHKGIVRSSSTIDPGIHYPPYSNFKYRVLRKVIG